MAGWVEGIRRALVLGLVLIAGTVIEQAPSVGPPGILVCSRFLISVCMFIVSNNLLISSDCSRRGSRVVEPLSYGCNMCSAVTVECCVLYPCYVGMFAVM